MVRINVLALGPREYDAGSAVRARDLAVGYETVSAGGDTMEAA